MKKLLLAATLSLALFGCDTVKVATAPVDVVTLKKTAFAARATYVGLLEVAVNVTDLPRCERAPKPCVYQATVNTIRSVQRTAGEATSKAEKYANELTVDPTALSVAVQIATESVSVFKATVESNRGGN